MSFSAPSDYVQLPFTTDPNDLADAAIVQLQAEWDGWEPNDGDPEVVLIEALAPMAANAAQIASNMPPAALIAFGTKLLGVPYQPGVPASATAIFTVQDTNGPYDIPAGSEVDIGGIAFQTLQDLVVPNGQTTGSVQISANDPGSFANQLSGADWAAVSLPVFVTNMTLQAPTSGGIDQQDDNAYLNSVAQELQLRARGIITLVDFEIVAVNVNGIARAVAVADGTHPRNITVFVTDPDGQPVSSTLKSELGGQYAQTRMVNAVIAIDDAAYTTVSVTYEALSLPGVDPTQLQASVNARLALELSPAGWGAPTSGNGAGLTWVDQPVVHVNRLIGVISGVAGVNYVLSCSISANEIAELSANLSTGSPITSLPVVALVNAIPNGAVITLKDGTNTQTWTLSSAANVGDTALLVASQTPNHAYASATTTISGPVSGDLTMNGGNAGPLPEPGTFSGTIDTPTV